jgi:hypothetical protein
LSRGDLLALAGAVWLFDAAYLVPPRNVVLWEVVADLGLVSALLLLGSVLHGSLGRLAPRWVSIARMELLFAASAAALCTVLLVGGFLTTWVPTGWGTLGPRWPLVAFLVTGLGVLLSRLRHGPQPAEPDEHEASRTLGQSVLLALVALAMTLIVVEAGARWLLVERGYDVQAAQASPEPTLAHDSESDVAAIELSRLVRPSSNPRRVYELRPGLKAQISIPFAATTRFETNSFSMRGPEVTLDKPPGTLRIAGLGDSVMFGWGVEYAETHLALLGEMLQEADPEHRYQVLNFGVPGYNTVMERESYLELARQFSPDLVVLTVVGNDTDLPNFLQRPRNPFCLHRAFLSGLLQRIFLGRDPYADHEILVAQSSERSLRFAAQRGRTPIGSERLLGTENALAALQALHRDVLASGAQLVVAVDYEDLDQDLEPGPANSDGFREIMLEAARLAGIPVADPRRRIVEYLRDHGLRSRDLCVGDHDWHPNPTRHRLMAEELLVPALELVGKGQDE